MKFNNIASSECQILACAGFYRKKSKNERDVRGQLYNIFAIKEGYMKNHKGAF